MFFSPSELSKDREYRTQVGSTQGVRETLTVGQVGPSTRDPSRYNPNALIKQVKEGGAGAKQQGTETHIQIAFMFLNHWLLIYWTTMLGQQ